MIWNIDKKLLLNKNDIIKNIIVNIIKLNWNQRTPIPKIPLPIAEIYVFTIFKNNINWFLNSYKVKNLLNLFQWKMQNNTLLKHHITIGKI